MGGHFWSYVVPYQESVQTALEELREKEFQAGRFWQPAEVRPGLVGRIFRRPPVKPTPPRNIREALKKSAETGTRSILDMERVSETADYGAVSPVPPDILASLFGTERPELGMIEKSDEFLEMLNRGQGVYIIIYSRDGKPHQIYFAGYSYD